MPEIKLWYSPGACSLAPHICLRQAGVDFDLIKQKLASDGPSLPEEFRAINPKMQVPVLAIDGETITENPAIMTAIANLAPAKQLLGRTPMETVRVYELLAWLSSAVHSRGYGGLWRPQRFSDDPQVFDILKRKARLFIEECYDQVESQLVGIHAIGDSFTVADAYLFVFWRWGKRIDLNMEKKYPKFTKLASAVLKLKSTRAAMTAEELEVPKM